jgi:anti-sigma regulatory factor (Ser/Thr protein kinase)
MSDSLSITLPIKPESAGWAREALAEFRDHLELGAFTDLRLIVSELVADAVRAEAEGSDSIDVRVEVRDRDIQVVVIDGEAAYRLPPRRPALGEPGWGFFLTRLLAARWEHQRDGARSGVCVEMPLAGAA